MAAAKKTTATTRKRRELKKVDKGQVHIQSSFNNTLVTVTDAQGNAIAWSSAGSLGYKGSRKGTPFAAQMATETAVKAAKEHGLRSVEVYVKGPGAGRESAIRAIAACDVEITLISDVSPYPTTDAGLPSAAEYNFKESVKWRLIEKQNAASAEEKAESSF